MRKDPFKLRALTLSARIALLPLFLIGQGRLLFHNHVSIFPAFAANTLSADQRGAQNDGEANCPTCRLAAHSACAHLNVAAVLLELGAERSVAVAAWPQVSVSSAVSSSARAPPFC